MALAVPAIAVVAVPVVAVTIPAIIVVGTTVVAVVPVGGTRSPCRPGRCDLRSPQWHHRSRKDRPGQPLQRGRPQRQPTLPKEATFFASSISTCLGVVPRHSAPVRSYRTYGRRQPLVSPHPVTTRSRRRDCYVLRAGSALRPLRVGVADGKFFFDFRTRNGDRDVSKPAKAFCQGPTGVRALSCRPPLNGSARSRMFYGPNSNQSVGSLDPRSCPISRRTNPRRTGVPLAPVPPR